MRFYIHLMILIIIFETTSSSSPSSSSSSSSTDTKTTHRNHQLLQRLGLKRIRGPNTHHRKRLAIESRHHSRNDDSHMFIIKLPPNPHYYIHHKPLDKTIKIANNLPMNFLNNGKPNKIYHWNIPIIQKIINKKLEKFEKKQHSKKSTTLNFDNNDSIIWNNILENDTKDKKMKKPSYYVPKIKGKQFNNHFTANGKPHSFYVLNDHNIKADYHRLLP